MAGILATPSFVAGAKDELAAVDVYTEKGESVVNSVKDYVDKAKSLIPAELVRGGKALLKDLPLIKSTIANLKTGNLKSLSSLLGSSGVMSELTKLSSVTSDVTSAVRGATDSVKGGILDSVGGVIGDAKAIINGTNSIIPINQVLNARSTGDLINAICNDKVMSVINPPGDTGLLAGAIKTASSLGIKDSFGTIVNAAVSGNKAALMSVAKGSLNTLIKSSDLKSIKSIGDVLPAGSVKSILPSVVSDTAANYSLPQSCTAADIQDEYADANLAFMTVDPNWNSADWTPSPVATNADDPSPDPSPAPVSIPSIASLKNASADFTKVVDIGAKLSSNANDKVQLLAAEFKDVNPIKDIQQQFPTVAVTQTTPVEEYVPKSGYGVMYLIHQASNLEDKIAQNDTLISQSEFNYKTTMSRLTDPVKIKAATDSFNNWMSKMSAIREQDIAELADMNAEIDALLKK